MLFVGAGGVGPLVGRLSCGCTAVVLRARTGGTDSNRRAAGSEPARLRRRTPGNVDWKWSRRESNPRFSDANAASSRWTTTPISKEVRGAGFEPALGPFLRRLSLPIGLPTR